MQGNEKKSENLVLVLNLIPDQEIAAQTYTLLKGKRYFTLFDQYCIPREHVKELSDVLNQDLKYLNIRFVYLVENIGDVNPKDNWIKQRASKHDIIISKTLEMQIC